MLRFFIFFLALIYLGNTFGQQKPDPLTRLDGAPDYIQLMHANPANFFEVEKSYREYYSGIPFLKNTYTQYYKRWMHWASKNHDEKGFTFIVDPQKEALLEKKLLSERSGSHSRSPVVADWTFAGPNQTFDTDGQTEVTWQTNIYSLDVSLTNTSVIFAGGESGGIWKSIDKGLHWTLQSKNILHGAFGAIRIHPKNPDTVYAATDGKIIKTNDGGQNWTSVYSESGLWTHDIAIKPSNANVVLVATNKGLLRSSDGGKTWTRAFTNETWAIKFKVANPNTVFAIRQNATAADFIQSVDNGVTWTNPASNFYTPPAGVSVTGALIAVCPSNANKMYSYLCGTGTDMYGYIGVFVSNNDGINWSNTNPTNAVGIPYSIPSHSNLMAHNGTTGFDQGFYDMAIIVNPVNDQQLIAGGTSWFKSTDGGVNWNPLGSYVGGLPWSHPDIQSLTAVGTDLWITSDGGINYSTDFANTMVARMNGISGADLWGFDSGWNDDILVGGRYHNGNMAWYEKFPKGKFYRMGGAEAATGYVNPGADRKMYFSDIGGYSIYGNFEEGVRYFPVALFPNESYAYYQASPMTWHPNCWNFIYLGNKNKLWLSKDGGTSFNALYTFPGNEDNLVFEIEISRSHPNILYCSQWDGTDDAIWKSEDGRQTFKQVTKLPLPNNNDRVKMSLSNENPNHLWVALTYGSNGKKIYYSPDGGMSWLNWTTPLLDNITISDVLCQYGTDGGVYIGTNRGVYYRNHLMAEWMNYSSGLPLSAQTNRLRPFYRDGKIRNGCWGFGVWESPLAETSIVQAKIMADKVESDCLRDTFYLDDYSVLNHSGASWNWQIDDAAYLSDVNQRKVKVVFNSAGVKRVVMNIKTSAGKFADTLMLIQRNGCTMDSIPGKALSLNGTNAAASISAMNINSNTVTMMAWIKANGLQRDYAGIFFCRGGSTVAGLSVLNNNELRYHWNGNNWDWSSRNHIISNEWVHVALVVEPDKVTIYNNGIGTVQLVNNGPEEFDAPINIGLDPSNNRYFKGEIDEFAAYNRALSQAEIREMMHLTKTHTQNTGLLSYHQFNEADPNLLDHAGVFHGSLVGGASLIPSLVPIGPGFSKRLDMRGSGIFNFGSQVGVEIKTANAGVFPNGEVVLFRINYPPTIKPLDVPVSSAYWILHNYGINKNYSSFSSVHFTNIGKVKPTANAKEYFLFKRKPNADTELWTFSDTCTQMVTGAAGSALINNARLQTEGQWIISKTKEDTGMVTKNSDIIQDFSARFSLFPNPVTVGESLTIMSNIPEEISMTIYDIKGHKIKTYKWKNQIIVDTNNFSPGTYTVSLETNNVLQFKRWVIVK